MVCSGVHFVRSFDCSLSHRIASRRSVVAVDKARGQIVVTPPPGSHSTDPKTFTYDSVYDWT
jgi:hypothetical protein